MTRIVMVEYNELNRDMLSRRLVRRDFEVECAVDGEQGVAMVKKELPDLVLIDVSLPGIDGLEATRQLKADTQTKGIPIIVLTAHAMAEDREKAMAAGADGCSVKPIKFEELTELIDSLLV
ncbi:MAG: response regulator [Pirellulales bacterium]|jgi:CheY-like chemotaxis protein|tara:strand:- start:6960 stop:7322 length:363 start_codon:yes stop_codon:yes gene_type:complete